MVNILGGVERNCLGEIVRIPCLFMEDGLIHDLQGVANYFLRAPIPFFFILT